MGEKLARRLVPGDRLLSGGKKLVEVAQKIDVIDVVEMIFSQINQWLFVRCPIMVFGRWGSLASGADEVNRIYVETLNWKLVRMMASQTESR